MNVQKKKKIKTKKKNCWRKVKKYIFFFRWITEVGRSSWSGSETLGVRSSGTAPGVTSKHKGWKYKVYLWTNYEMMGSWELTKDPSLRLKDTQNNYKWHGCICLWLFISLSSFCVSLFCLSVDIVFFFFFTAFDLFWAHLPFIQLLNSI